jgi:hypothetical protein
MTGPRLDAMGQLPHLLFALMIGALAPLDSLRADGGYGRLERRERAELARQVRRGRAGARARSAAAALPDLRGRPVGGGSQGPGGSIGGVAGTGGAAGAPGSAGTPAAPGAGGTGRRRARRHHRRPRRRDDHRLASRGTAATGGRGRFGPRRAPQVERRAAAARQAPEVLRAAAAPQVEPRAAAAARRVALSARRSAGRRGRGAPVALSTSRAVAAPTPIVVKTFTELAAVRRPTVRRAVIHIDGTLGNGWSGNSGDRLEIKSNKTIVGLRAGTQLKAASTSTAPATSSCATRRPRSGIERDQAWDNINIEGSSKNVWVDHCEFWDGQDGNADVVKGADTVTFTWMHLRLRAGGPPAQPVQPDRSSDRRAESEAS